MIQFWIAILILTPQGGIDETVPPQIVAPAQSEAACVKAAIQTNQNPARPADKMAVCLKLAGIV